MWRHGSCILASIGTYIALGVFIADTMLYAPKRSI